MPDSTFNFKGDEYTFNPEVDLGIGMLRQIKRWYPSIGTYTAFTQAATYGDPDALSCIVWVAQQRAGRTRIAEPMRSPDFSVGEFMGSFAEGTGLTFPNIMLKLDEKTYTFDTKTQLTRDVLRKIKHEWYPELGTYVGLMLAIAAGDPDAMAVLAWLVRTSAGERDVPAPDEMDFGIGEVINSYEFDAPPEQEAVKVPAPRGQGKDTPVDPPLPSDGKHSSAAIPNDSGGNTTSSSPTPSTSRRKKPSAGLTLNTADGPTG